MYMRYRQSFNIDNGIIDSFSYVIDIFGVETDHGDSTIFHHMDMMFIDHIQTLSLV